MRDSGAQLGAIDRLRKPKNTKTGCQPREMRIEIENPAVTNRHRLEYTIAEQKAAIRDRNMRVFQCEQPAILPHAHHGRPMCPRKLRSILWPCSVRIDSG